MRVLFLLATVLMTCLPHSLTAQALIGIPESGNITIDGQLMSQEWQLAAKTFIVQSNGDTSWVLVQHNKQSLFLAFYGNLQSGQLLFPEVLIDRALDKSQDWQNDDWWFHVSATDCDYQGAYGNFDSCAPVRPNWLAVPNFTTGNPNTDTVEIEIPFSKIQYTYTAMDTIGLALILSNTVNIFDGWPAGVDHLSPTSWANAVLLPRLTSKEQPAPAWSLYPNPASSEINLFSDNLGGHAQVTLYDLKGQELERFDLDLRQHTIHAISTDLESGMYLFHMTTKNGSSAQWFQIK